MNKSLPVVFLILGAVLLALSFAWSRLASPAKSWTEEQETRLTELGTEIQRLRFAIIQAENNPQVHAGPSLGELQGSLHTVRESYDTLQQQFEAARDGGPTAEPILRWTGILLLVAGALGTFVKTRQA